MDTASRSTAVEREVDLRLVAQRVWQGRRWVVASVLAFTAAFAAAAVLLPSIYRAEAVLVPVGSAGSGMGMLGSSIMQLSGVTSLAGINLGGGDQQTEEGLAVLQSREFTEAFIHDENLMPVLFYRRWDEGKQQWKGARENWPTAAQAAKFFDKYVRKVNREKMTGLIHMTIDWTDPRLAADWANKLVARLNDEMRSRAISRSTVAVQYLEKELTTTTTVETRQAIGKIMAEQINSKMLANVTKEYAFRVVDRALPPDRNDRMSPRRLLLLALGLALGLLSGVFAVLVSGSIAKSANAN